MSVTRDDLGKTSHKRKISNITNQSQSLRAEMNDDEEKTIYPQITPKQKRKKAEEAVKTLQMELETTLSSSGNTFSSLITRKTTIVKNDIKSEDALHSLNMSGDSSNDLTIVKKENKSIDIAQLEMLLNESKYLANYSTPIDLLRAKPLFSPQSSVNNGNNNTNKMLTISEDISALNNDCIQKSSIVCSRSSISEIPPLSGSKDVSSGFGLNTQDSDTNSRLQTQASICNSVKVSGSSSQNKMSWLKRKSYVAANTNVSSLPVNSSESNHMSAYSLSASSEEFLTPACIVSSKNQKQVKRVQSQDLMLVKYDNDNKLPNYMSSEQKSACSNLFKKLASNKEPNEFRSSQVNLELSGRDHYNLDSSSLSQNDEKGNMNNSYEYIDNLGCPSSPLHSGIDKDNLLTMLTPLYKNSSNSSQENIGSWLSFSQSSNSLVLQSNDDPLLDEQSVADPHPNEHHLDDFQADAPIGNHSSMDSYDSGCNMLQSTASQQYCAVQAAEYQSTGDLFDTLGSTFQERVTTEIETFLYYMRQSFEDTSTADPEAQEIRVDSNLVNDETEQYELLLQMHRLAETITANICYSKK